MEIPSITSKVLQTLRDKIIVGQLKSGRKLNELDITKELGISRPPLREALRILEADHLVVSIPRKGTYVSELSVKDFVEFSQTREMIECYCVDLLKKTNIRNLPKVQTALEKTQTLPGSLITVDQEQSFHHIQVFLDFHRSLVKSTENSLLFNIYNSISHSLARYQYIYFHIEEAAQHSFDRHKKVFDLINRGDFDQAKEELRKHINYTVELVKTRILY